MTDNDIREYFFNNKKRIIKSRLTDIPKDVYQYLINRYNDSSCIEETIYRINLNINKHPICVCGKPVKYKSPYRFYESCGNELCIKTISVRHYKETNICKYGVDNPAKNEIIKNKAKKTCIEKYGFTSPLLNNSIKEKTKQTCFKKYGVEIPQQSEDVKQKIKKSNELTLIHKHNGVIIYPMQNNDVKQKSKETCLIKYGVEYPGQLKEVWNKINNTCIERYGTKYAQQSEKIKQKIINSLIQTNINKYGVKYPSSLDNIKNKIKETYIKTCLDKYGVTNVMYCSNIIEKINNTKKSNGTFNTSKSEDECYKILKEKYPDVIRQYKSKLYPFNCDFYISSLDLYIECNFHWSHGGKPFEGTDSDLQTLQNWCERDTKYYYNAIDTWTIRDVNKRNIAKKNNLNYIELWNTIDIRKI